MTTLLFGLPVLLGGAVLALGLRSSCWSAAAALVSQGVATLLVLRNIIPVLRGSGPLEVTWPRWSSIDHLAFQVGASGAFFLAWSLPLMLLGTIYSVRCLRPYFERGRHGGPQLALLNMVCVSFLLISGKNSIVFLLGLELAASAAWLLVISSYQPQKLQVTVIAGHREAVDELQEYLSRAGVILHATSDLRTACLMPPPAANAVVIFPDEYAVDEAVAGITSLRAARPRLPILILTSTPQSFHSAIAPTDQSLPAMVFPKPAFGGIILDTIREHARSEAL